eukprot:467836_1
MKHLLSLLIICIISHSSEGVGIIINANTSIVIRAMDTLFASVCNLTPVDPRPSITEFDSENIPPVALGRYLERMAKYSRASTSVFVVSTIYLHRYWMETRQPLHWYTVHRLLCTSVIVAHKVLNDDLQNNKAFIKICGLSQLEEINRLEVRLLNSLNFNLLVTPSQYKPWYDALTRNDTSSELKAIELWMNVKTSKTIRKQPKQPKKKTRSALGSMRDMVSNRLNTRKSDMVSNRHGIRDMQI